MAGIGFELRRILSRDTFSSQLRAYLYAALISAGPWMLSILCIAVLGLFRGAGMNPHAHEVFRATTTLTYALSLILVGGVQLVATRFLADKLYINRPEHSLSAFFTAATMVLAIGLPIEYVLLQAFLLPLLYKLVAAALFGVISLIWLGMIVLSAVKDYTSIVLAFVAGTLASIAGAFIFGSWYGLVGFFTGYAVGQALLFFWLLARILAEFRPADIWDWELFAYFGKYWELALVGFLYNAAIWADKMVFWTAPDARLITPWFHTHDLYEAPVFYAYLSVVPMMSIFLVRIETTFYEHYRNYYGRILERAPLSAIVEERHGMVRALKQSLREVFISQGSLTLLCIAFAPDIAALTRLDPLQISILRIALLGAFLQALFSLVMVVLFYFDLRREVLILSITFLLSNSGLSWASIQLGQQWYGYGYCYACLISLLVGYGLLSTNMNKLEYITFARQPIA